MEAKLDEDILSDDMQAERKRALLESRKALQEEYKRKKEEW